MKSLIKFIASILIIFSTTLFGIRKSDGLKKRIEWLELFKTSLCYIKEELRYSLIPISQLIKKLAELEQFQKLMLYNKLKLDNSFSVAFNEAIERSTAQNNLLKEDISIIKGFGESFGFGDLESQLSLCTRTAEQLEYNIKTAKDKYSNYGKLYKALGISAGAVLILLLI